MPRLEVSQLSASPPSAKSAPVRALLFDISFLMLCHVAQTYGSEVRDVALTLPAQLCSLSASSSGQSATVPMSPSSLAAPRQLGQSQLVLLAPRPIPVGAVGTS